MFQPVSFFVGLRYSKSQNRTGFISFITFFSITGILLGVASLITVVSVMNGFEGELKKRILGLVPHVLITATPEQIKQQQWLSVDDVISSVKSIEHVKSAKPYVEMEAFIQVPNQLQPLQVQGIFPDSSHANQLISSNMQVGKLSSLTAGQYNIVLGAMLARKLGVNYGDQVRLLLTKTRFTPMGRIPLQRTFTVSGIFHVGSQIDDSLVLIHGSDAAKLMRRKGTGVDRIRLYLDDAFTADDVATKLETLPNMSGLTITTWRTSQGTLFEAVRMEKNMMWIMLSLIVAVAAFNIVSALVMVVIEKQGEISILKTLGMNRLDIMKVFMTQGIINGAWGAMLGTVVGVLLTHYINDILAVFGINILGGGYSSQQLPTDLQWLQVTTILFSALLMSFLATLYPAFRAANTQPAEVLSNE